MKYITSPANKELKIAISNNISKIIIYSIF